MLMLLLNTSIGKYIQIFSRNWYRSMKSKYIVNREKQINALIKMMWWAVSLVSTFLHMEYTCDGHFAKNHN